jgi:hypothetical protein
MGLRPGHWYDSDTKDYQNGLGSGFSDSKPQDDHKQTSTTDTNCLGLPCAQKIVTPSPLIVQSYKVITSGQH